MTDFKADNKNDPKIDVASNGQVFSISRLNLARRVLALALTVLLCFSLFMCELSRFNQSHQIMLISKMTPIYILLIAFRQLWL